MTNPRPAGRGLFLVVTVFSGGNALEDAYIAAHGADVYFAIAVTADVQVIVLSEGEVGIEGAAHSILIQFETGIFR